VSVKINKSSNILSNQRSCLNFNHFARSRRAAHNNVTPGVERV